MSGISAYEAAALAKMPYKTLSKVNEDPNYVELSKLRREVYRNCSSVHSARNGNMGHLGLAMPPTQYAARNGGVAYVGSPNNPGPYDETIAANAGSVLRSRREAEHQQKIDNHLIEVAVKNVLKNMLGQALPKWLLAEIEDRDTGLNNVSIMDILDHAFDRRGQIDDDLVDEYTTMLNAPIDMAQGFNVYVERQEECRDFFADAQQPITGTQLAAKGQMHVGQTGLFKIKYLEWKRRAIANKTWNEFKTFWNREFTDYETINKITSKANGLGAHAVINEQNEAYDTLEEAMDNLAFAATTSNNALEQLTATNAKLAQQLTEAMKLLKKAQEENNVLLKIIQGAGLTQQGWSQSKNKKRGKIDYEKTDHLMDPEGYCWSCGYRVSKTHNSMTCEKKKPGHQVGATRANIMGGSKNHHWWPRE